MRIAVWPASGPKCIYAVENEESGMEMYHQDYQSGST